MKSTIRFYLAAVAAGAVCATGAAAQDKKSTLEEVKARGELICIVNTGLPGFAAVDKDKNWKGFDVDFCKATAAAIFGDASKVKYRPATGKNRFSLLNSREGDVIWRNTTWSFKRDVDVKLAFQGVNYYDGQGFMIRKDKGVKSAKDKAMDGASICIQTGTTTELNLADFFKAQGMSYEAVPIESNEEARTNYLADRCDVYTTDRSGLAATRASLDNPDEHVVLPEVVSKEPLGPVTRHGDDQWSDIIRWVLNATIVAEEFGITQANVKELAGKKNKVAEINRLLGSEDDLGGMLGLSKDWVVNLISAVGNYGEIFDRNIGPKTPIALERGQNALYKNGGLIYSPPFR